MRRLVVLSALVVAAAPAAAASGPSPGVMQGGDGVSAAPLRYVAVRHGAATDVLAWRADSVVRTTRVKGNWGIPLVTVPRQAGGVSHDGRTLVLGQFNLTHYRVRDYDLREGRLLSRVIADKRQASWVMSGYPMARATSPDGRWEYKLYSQPDNYPFVHALDTVSRTAICVGIPWKWTQDMSPADMAVKNGKLVIELGLNATRYVLDTKTLLLAT